MSEHEFAKTLTPRSLLEIPANIACRIVWAGHAVREAGHYAVLGIQEGRFARVLARFPEAEPRFVELEVDSHRVSLPVCLASQVLVSPI